MSTFDPDKVERFPLIPNGKTFVFSEDYDNLLRLYRRMESTREVPIEFVPCPTCGRPEHGGKP